MSFSIKLQNCKSDKIVVDKNIDDITEMTGVLRDNCDIVNPTILLEVSADELAKCNYMYIPDFKRHYYITSIVAVNNNLCEVSGHVDVLMTYKSGIRGCEGITYRQEKQYNLYINDGVLKTYANPNVVIKNFSKRIPENNNLIMLVAGGAE